jgi:hypothetical protein
MTAVPKESFPKRGFGLIQVPFEEWQPRIDAVTSILAAVESWTMPENSGAFQQSASIVKGLFSRIAVGDCYDWYSTSRLLGHPSPDLSSEVSAKLKQLKSVVGRQDREAFAEICRFFHDECVTDMLDNYLGLAVRKENPVEEDGWAYILWSSSERDALHVGAAGGTVEEVLKRLNAENPGYHPYGVLAAYLVHDPLVAHRGIERVLDPHALGLGFYRVDLGTARRALHELLLRSENTVKSPWHAGVEAAAHVEAPRNAVTM